jgi:lipopolysaccharide export system protein LptA
MDALTRTSADRLSIQQRTGEMRGEGNVCTSYSAAERNGVTNLAPQPAHICSDQVRANRDTGRAVYSGHARLWQGDSVIEANSVELFRNERRLEARGNALGLFPQVQGPPGTAPALASSASLSSGGRELVLWRVHGASLSYWSGEGRVRLEGNANAESRAGQIASRAMDLFFASAPGGAQELTRAVATGGASVRQELRRGIAERGEYTVADGKFVLSGGTPTLFDAVQGTTTGRQLTFFLADDKILIDSEEGLRTLTKHRVEK